MLGLGVAGLVLWAASDTSIKALSVPIIALTSAAANLSTIAAGPIDFGEALPAGHVDLVLRVLAFALAIVAAALAPPPSARAEALESSGRASLSG